MPPKSETNPTSIRLTPAGMDLWQKIADELGMNRTAAMELMIREKAAALGFKTAKAAKPQA